MADQSRRAIVWYEEVGRGDIPRVGGKNASLGEMVRELTSAGIRVPPGFATTAEAYWAFVEANDLRLQMRSLLDRLDQGDRTLDETGRAIRDLFLHAAWPDELASAIVAAYRQLCELTGRPEVDVAVRSSATAEDLPDASFAGQQETFLNIRGERALLNACRRCYASLFTDRAISYRRLHGFDDMGVALSIGVQQMVRSDLGGSGVMFSIDTETGFRDLVLIDAAWGLGENVVQGVIDPDEYQVFKPLLSDPAVMPIIGKKCGGKEKKLVYAAGDKPTRNVPTSKAERMAFVLEDREILALSRSAVAIEAHYGCPMDMEWARDGEGGEIFIVQARPETVQSRREAAAFKSYRITAKGRKLLSGLAIGDAVVAGRVCLIEDRRDMAAFVDGAILVTRTTDPDWVPVMKRAAAIAGAPRMRPSSAASWACRRSSAQAMPRPSCTTSRR